MGVEELTIEFENSLDGVYFPGQIIQGRVVLVLSEEKKMRGVEVQIRGKSRIFWTEKMKVKRRSTMRAHQHNADEEYFNHNMYVYGSKDGSVTIPEGRHCYPFVYQLPTEIPSSFEHALGHVRYYARANLDLPWAFDMCVKKLFTVNQLLDLNKDPRVTSEVEIKGEKSIGVLPKGNLSLVLKLSKSGFVPGENITMDCEIRNNSKLSMEGIKARLFQAVEFDGPTKNRTETFKAARFDKKEKIPAKQTVSWTGMHLEVPPLPPTDLPFCNIIDIKHYLEFTVRVPHTKNNLKVSSPLVIGSIPLKTDFPRFRYHKDTRVSENPATKEYNDLPSPSFEDSVHEGHPLSKDDDDKNAQGNWDFRPKYLRYHSI